MAKFNNPLSCDPLAILREARARYAALKSYRDCGEVQCRYEIDPELLAAAPSFVRSQLSDQPHVIRFRSWFRRPEYLRFEWIDPHPYPPLRHIENFGAIWGDGRGAGMCHCGKTTHDLDLKLAIAGATGVSMGAAHRFGTFFLPRLGNSAVLEDMPLPGVEDEVVEGVPCWKVRTQAPLRSEEFKASQLKVLEQLGKDAETIAQFMTDKVRVSAISLAQADFLIRRIQEGDTIETRRGIQVDLPLADDHFRSPDAHRPYGS